MTTARRRIARTAAYGGGILAAAGLTMLGVLYGQMEAAKRIIPLAEAPPPRADGRYGHRQPGRPLSVVVLGDSSAAGFGVRRPRETLASLLATGLARRLRRPVDLRVLAVVGAHSDELRHQVRVALEGDAPDLAVILIGANDVTRVVHREVAVRHLVDAVRAFRQEGTEVVVGTCPDLGAVQPIRPPLRWVARHLSRQMAMAQTVAVVEAGGRTVSLGSLLGPRFAQDPQRLFADDRFHPSAEGYALAATVLLPTAIATVLRQDDRPAALTATSGVRSLPEAAAEAVRRPGTEVSGVSVGGRERGPLGRWAELRHRVREALRAEASHGHSVAGEEPRSGHRRDPRGHTPAHLPAERVEGLAT